MNPHDPQTWQHIADHPAVRRLLGGKAFDPAWYDGDPALDIQRLREVALQFRQAHRNARLELHVLDDFTFYVSIAVPEIGTAEVYPTLDAENSQPCFYVELPDDEREYYPETVAEALALLQSVFSAATPSA